MKTVNIFFRKKKKKTGQKNGAHKKLQEKLGKNVPYMPCLARRTNTVVELSCNASAIVKGLFNVLEAI